MYMCPVCGYTNLKIQPYDEKNIPSEEICPCCGFQFGCDDNYDLDNLQKYYTIWREKWINNGSQWFSRKTHKPLNWNAKKQLEKIKV